MTYGSLGAGILTGAIRELPDWDEKDFRYTFYDYFKTLSSLKSWNF